MGGLEHFLGDNQRALEEVLDMLGVADFSALIDFNTAVAAAAKAKGLFAPFDIAMLALSALAPFLAVMALEFPIKEILSQLIKLVGFLP